MIIKEFKKLINQKTILKFFDRNLHLTREYLTWMNDKDLMKYSENRHGKHTKRSALKYYDFMKKNGNYFLAILDKKNEKHIGNISVYFDKINDVADISILIGDTNYIKCGYGIDAWQAIILYLKDILKVRKISAGTLIDNRPMIALMKKSNMKKDGVRKDHYLLNNHPKNIVYYAIINEKN
tara:strand:- start:1429 stop:1971 length:543 start_codon:yes stop_codon:yes gene_type:complete